MSPSTARWSQVVSSSDSDAARTSWDELTSNYRPAIHAYLRCRFGSDAADDLVQSFLTESTEGRWWSNADREHGSFRTHLRDMLRRFDAGHHDDPAHPRTHGNDIDRLVDAHNDPEVAFERDFARTLVGRVLAHMRDEQADAHEFEALLPSLLHRGDHNDIRRVASELGMERNTVMLHLRRMRMRMRELLRDEFSQLVAHPASLSLELLRVQRNLKHKKL